MISAHRWLSQSKKRFRTPSQRTHKYEGVISSQRSKAMRGSKPALTHGQALGLHPICVDRKEGCRLSLAMSRCPLGVATATFDFPTTPFQGRGGCRRRHQGWVCPVVRGVESGLMDGATGSVGHGGHLQIFFIMLPRAAFAQRSAKSRVHSWRCTGHPKQPHYGKATPETRSRRGIPGINIELQNFWRVNGRMSPFGSQDST